MDSASNDPLRHIADSLYPVAGPAPTVHTDAITGALPSSFDVSGFAAATLGLAVAEIQALERVQGITVNRRLCSAWFAMTVRPRDWELPPVWDAIAGLYQCDDGWIRLHTNAPHHRAAALEVLQCPADKDHVAAVVRGWSGDDLEAAIVAAGGCAARLRSAKAWAEHPQGRAVAMEPLIAWDRSTSTAKSRSYGSTRAPLAGLRVLDCTRVLAGPVCTRLLAGYGAEVLRIDPPGWREANVEPEVTLGKRLATLDMQSPEGREQFQELLAQADVFVHGYRPGALDGLGFPAELRRQINPSLIDVSLCAYGWSGPWAQRRGYDSLVQMSTGIVDAGMHWADGVTPTPLPVQALDHGTGYLMAAAVARALRVARETGGTALSARLSLARTAELLKSTRQRPDLPAFEEIRGEDLAPNPEHTHWGLADRLRFPLIDGAPLPRWILPARALHSDLPIW